MFCRTICPKSLAWYVILGLLFSLSVSYSGNFVVPVTVTNRTAHYLHVTINDKSFTYIAPENSIRTEVATDGVNIKAVYSPGQERDGTFSGSYPTSRTDNSSVSCSNDNGSCDSTTESRETRTPMPVNVNIFPQNLQ